MAAVIQRSKVTIVQMGACIAHGGTGERLKTPSSTSWSQFWSALPLPNHSGSFYLNYKSRMSAPITVLIQLVGWPTPNHMGFYLMWFINCESSFCKAVAWCFCSKTRETKMCFSGKVCILHTKNIQIKNILIFFQNQLSVLCSSKFMYQ